MATIPQDWANMDADDPNIDGKVMDFVSWSWSGASWIPGENSGSSVFDFRVYKDVAEQQSQNVDDESNPTVNVVYKIVDISGANRGFDTPGGIGTATRLKKELKLLSYATGANRLPKIGDPIYANSNSRLKSVVYRLEKDGVPDVWLAVFTFGPEEIVGSQAPQKPETGTPPIKKPDPWELGAVVQTSYSTEDFVLGFGYFAGSKTPREINDALASKTLPTLFAGEVASLDIVKNSAGDPLESPPPVKIFTANLHITKSFAPGTDVSGLIQAAKEAMTEVCESELEIGVASARFIVEPYTAKLVGFSAVNKQTERTMQWLPRQRHPYRKTNKELGWTYVDGSLVSPNAVAVNWSRSELTAFDTVEYIEMSMDIAVRELGWGYITLDRGYRKLENGEQKEIANFDARKSYSKLLDGSGQLVNMALPTDDVSCLRLYRTGDVGTSLSYLIDGVNNA